MNKQTNPTCWIVIKNLTSNSVLEVKTPNLTLRMRLTDPEQGKVRVEADGVFITREFDALILGTVMPGKEDKQGAVTVNQKMALMCPGEIGPVFITPTEISVNGKKLLP